MKIKLLVCFLLSTFSFSSVFSGELNWVADWGSSDYMFDTVIIGRVTDANASAWSNDLYVGYEGHQISAIVKFPELDNYQSSQTLVADFENTNGYYYYLELRAGDNVMAYSDLYAQSDVAFSLTGHYPMQRWTIKNFNSVPEPSSGLLFLIGGALVGLRRKRRAA